MTLLGNNMNNLRIILLAAAMMPSIVQCMDDAKNADLLKEGIAIDFSMYTALDSWAYTPESAALENEQINQCLLYMASLKNKYMAMSKEELGKIRYSKEIISSMNENERNVFVEIYNQKHNPTQDPNVYDLVEVRPIDIEGKVCGWREEARKKNGDEMITQTFRSKTRITYGERRNDGIMVYSSSLIDNELRIDLVAEYFKKNADKNSNDRT